MQPAGPARLLGDARRREPQPFSQSPDQCLPSWSPIRNGRTPTGPILRHGAGSATTGWLQNGHGPANLGGLKSKSAPHEPHLAGISWLGGASPRGIAQRRVERDLDDLDRRLDDLVAMAAVGADQLGRAGCEGRDRPHWSQVNWRRCGRKRGPRPGPVHPPRCAAAPGPGCSPAHKARELAAAPTGRRSAISAPPRLSSSFPSLRPHQGGACQPAFQPTAHPAVRAANGPDAAS